MKRIIERMPMEVTGLMLALASSGNLVEQYGRVYRITLGIAAVVIFVLFVLKIIVDCGIVQNSFDDPIAASALSTFAMGVMALSTYAVTWSRRLAVTMFVVGVILHLALQVNFIKGFMLDFNIEKVYPSHFVVFVGIAAGSVVAPSMGLDAVGRVLFVFGFLSYLMLLPLIVYRILVVKKIPDHLFPLTAIMAAPGSLTLAGYLTSFDQINFAFVLAMTVFTQFIFAVVLTVLPRMLKQKFHPSCSAVTFPLVISATAMQRLNMFLGEMGKNVICLQYLEKTETLVAVLVVVFIAYRYVRFVINGERKKYWWQWEQLPK